MPLGMNQTKTALTPNTTASFLAFGGTPPYTYAVLPGGAGGTIVAGTGAYTAPTQLNVNPTLPSKMYDTIEVTDSVAATFTSKILVGNALLLFCEIIAKKMNLPTERVFLWNQKIFQPTDAGIYVAIALTNLKMVGNNIMQDPNDATKSFQYSINSADLDVNVISRDSSALFNKELVAMTLVSQYSESQQEGNSFKIGKVPTSFKDLSGIDGAAIPFRFMITVRCQYAITASETVDYFDTFRDVQVITDQLNPYLLDNDQQFVFDNAGDPILKS